MILKFDEKEIQEINNCIDDFKMIYGSPDNDLFCYAFMADVSAQLIEIMGNLSDRVVNES